MLFAIDSFQFSEPEMESKSKSEEAFWLVCCKGNGLLTGASPWPVVRRDARLFIFSTDSLRRVGGAQLSAGFACQSRSTCSHLLQLELSSFCQGETS